MIVVGVGVVSHQDLILEAIWLHCPFVLHDEGAGIAVLRRRSPASNALVSTVSELRKCQCRLS